MKKSLQRLQFILLFLAVFLASAVAGICSLRISAIAAGQTPVRYNNIVALVNFKENDVDRYESDSANTLLAESLFNSSATGAAGEDNLQSYIAAASCGRVDYASHFYIVNLTKNSADYQNWDGIGYLPLFEDVLNELDKQFTANRPDVNFSKNGISIDGLTLYVNADTAEDRGDMYWPRQTTITNTGKKLLGKNVDKYMIIPRGISGKIGDTFLQVICHETLHMFGADDLYHYPKSDDGEYASNPIGYDSLFPVGIWDIMGTGSHNDPATMNAYYRRQCNFIDDTQFVTAEKSSPVTLVSAESPSGIIAMKFGEKKINGQSEFFVLEKRNFQSGYDSALAKYAKADSGYLVYRVKTMTDAGGNDVMTGNRLKKNGDEIVFFDNKCSDALSGRSMQYNAVFPEEGSVDKLVYSDSSKAAVRLELTGGAATVEDVVVSYRVKVTYGTEILDSSAFKLTADGAMIPLVSDEQTAIDGTYAVSVPFGSEVSVAAEGYSIPNSNFTAESGGGTKVLKAYREKKILFLDGETPVKEIAASDGTNVYASGADGKITALCEIGTALTFTANGYAFAPADFTFDGDVTDLTVALTKTVRTIRIDLGEGVSGNVKVKVNGGEAQEVALEGHILTLELKNGDVLTLEKENFVFQPLTIDHLTADDKFVVSYEEYFNLTAKVFCDDQPLSNMTFDYYIDGELKGQVTTDSEGAFSLTAVRKGAKLSLKAKGYSVADAILDGSEAVVKAQKLATLPVWVLGGMGGLLLVILVCVFAHDYRKKRHKK